MKYISDSEEQTLEIAYELGRRLRPGMIVGLVGELGAGKTVFTRGLCKALAIEDVKSPTFTLVNEYKNADNLTVYHIDGYRLDGVDPESSGILEYLYSDGISIIEWAEILGIEPDISITITGSGDEPREITISEL